MKTYLHEEGKMDENNGVIRVTIQEASRMKAITELAQAVNKLADALKVTPHVAISDCQFTGSVPGVTVDTTSDIVDTIIMEVE